MPKYVPSDDGKTIDGRIIVFIRPPGSADDAPSSKNDPAKSPRLASALVQAQAASMTAAAEEGVPFCEHCAEAHADLGRQLEQSA